MAQKNGRENSSSPTKFLIYFPCLVERYNISKESSSLDLVVGAKHHINPFKGMWVQNVTSILFKGMKKFWAPGGGLKNPFLSSQRKTLHHKEFAFLFLSHPNKGKGFPHSFFCTKYAPKAFIKFHSNGPPSYSFISEHSNNVYFGTLLVSPPITYIY